MRNITLDNDFTKTEILELAREFRNRRLYLGISQLKLARLAGISQSMINKFENGRIDPVYSTILKIDKALMELENVSKETAKDIMVKEIISVTSSMKIVDVLSIMKKNDFSQLLVFDGYKLLGVVYEKDLFDVMFEKKDIFSMDISNYIKNFSLIIPLDTNIDFLNFLFSNKRLKCVLVGNMEKIEGIITKSDLFK